VPKTFKQSIAEKGPNPTELMVTRGPQLGLDGIAIRSCVVLVRRSKRHLYPSRRPAACPMKVRSDIRTTLAARLADKQRLDVGQLGSPLIAMELLQR
jgi:hypothetical protein